jgi:small GTP-binding protein
MPMPHRTQLQLIKRRLVGKEGSARSRELRAILAELPDYRNGPYADIRKWVHAELDRTRVRAGVTHRDSIAVRRQGAAQIALVGAPNAGKSSLLEALSDIAIKTGDYAFTTTRPVPALTRIRGVLVQLVEIPGLLEGATRDRGGGRALLGVLRQADAVLFCHPAGTPLGPLMEVRTEVANAGIVLPAALAVTKLDEASLGSVESAAAATGLPAIGVSVLDDDTLEACRWVIWNLTGLIRVFLRRDRGSDP